MGPLPERVGGVEAAFSFSFLPRQQAFSLDGRSLAAVSSEGDFEVRDLLSGEVTGRRRLPPGVNALALGSTPGRLAYADKDGLIRSMSGTAVLRGRPGEYCLAYHAAAGVIAARADGVLVAWNPVCDSDAVLTPTLPKPLSALQVTPDSRHVLFLAGERGEALGVATRDCGGWRTTPLAHHGPPVVDAALAEDGRHVLLATHFSTCASSTPAPARSWRRSPTRPTGTWPCGVPLTFALWGAENRPAGRSWRPRTGNWRPGTGPRGGWSGWTTGAD